MATQRVRYVVEMDNASARRAAVRLAHEIERQVARVNLLATTSGGGAGGSAAQAAAAANASRTTKEMQKQSHFAASIQRNLVGGFAAFVSVRALANMAQATYELGSMAEKAENLEDAFSAAFSLEGTDPAQLLERLREASKGMASDVDLMSQALRALRLGVTSDMETMGKLLEIATKRGQEFGRSTADAFNDIVLGIGRLSPRILDNLGFLVKVEVAYQKYAEQLGIVTGEMTVAQQRQAILNEVLLQAADDGEAAVNEYEQLGAALKNLKVALGDYINTSTPATEAVGGMAQAANIAADNVNEMNDQMSALRDEHGGYVGALAAITKEFDAMDLAVAGLLQSIPVLGGMLGTLGLNVAGARARGRASDALPVDWAGYAMSSIGASGRGYSPLTWAERSAMNALNVPRDQNIAAYQRGVAQSTLPGNEWDLEAILEQEKERERMLKKQAADAEKAQRAWESAAEDVADAWMSVLEEIPGLFGTSPLTQEQLDMAEMGIPQNFADNYLRRLKDEVRNGVDWEGVDIADAAGALGLDASAWDPEAIIAQFEAAWENSSLFADAANLKFIDVEAVQASIEEQAKAEQGRENIKAMFGLGDEDSAEQLKALGIEIYDPVEQGMMGQIMERGDVIGTELFSTIYGGFESMAADANWGSLLYDSITSSVVEEVLSRVGESSE